MMHEHEIELTVDEIEYLTLKYLYEQKLLGRDLIMESEIMEYLGESMESGEEDRMLCINDDGINHLKSLQKHYLN
jgi:hypothetical protein